MPDKSELVKSLTEANAEIGKRTLALERHFNEAAGFNASDDRLPDFFKTEKLAPHDATFTVPDDELDEVFNFVE